MALKSDESIHVFPSILSSCNGGTIVAVVIVLEGREGCTNCCIIVLLMLTCNTA
jgi:hypothetical protein